MILKEGKNHHSYQVLSVNIEETELEKRLQALGLTVGSLITVLNNDKKGSMTVKFRGTRFAIGKKIADHIQISEVQ